MTTQQGIQIFKWLAVLIVAILLFMLGRGCGKGKTTKPASDTLSIKRDTLWVQSITDTFYTPQITKTKYVPEYRTDTLEVTEYIKVKVDTAAILKDYLATRYYHDSIAVQYGKVYINDTITKNKIASRGVKTSFSIPVVKETITLTRPKRNIFYAGFGAKGSEKSFLEQTEIAIALKSKNDKVWIIEGAMSREGTVLAGGKILIPIRLNKNR